MTIARKPSLTSLIRDAPGTTPAAAPGTAPSAAPSAAPRVRRRSKDRTISNAITINLKHSKNAAEIVRSVAGAFGWRETVTLAEDCNANVFWYERAISVGEVKLLNECQRVNMIPGMHDIGMPAHRASNPAAVCAGCSRLDPRLRFPRAAAKKTSLAKALNRMRTLFPSEFDFYPQTWTLPAQLESFRHHCDEAEKHGGGKVRHTRRLQSPTLD